MAGTLILDPDEIRDISGEVLDSQGRMRVLPAAYWAGTTIPERALFGHRHGIYSFPTEELVAHLREVIGGRTAVEIGAGHGVLAEALDIPATDNRQQEMPRYRAVYELSGQPPVRYGPNIIDCDAAEAIRRYRPQVVIGCWVTHLYDPDRHEAGGNEIGIDEDAVIGGCETYVLIGNEHVHRAKPVLAWVDEITYPEWLYSRAHNGARDFIATWGIR
jgi:hypothetical protein